MNLSEQIIIGVISCIGIIISTLFIMALRSLFANTVAVKILTEKMDQLVKNVNEIPKLKEDVRVAHRLIKELKLKEE